ncbi:MAG TPA: endonuclease/exonuclease/phosphatase family protein [Arenibacter sp.]|nr:endonuclease/exonuclease/phosphatase family protein [Arenibacter sp.]
MGFLYYINKFLFFINLILGSLLLASCLVPHIFVIQLPYLSLLSLLVPLLVLFNFIFLIYWWVQGSRYLWFPLLVLVMGYFFLGTFFKFRLSEQPIDKEDISVMSFNARGFNKIGLIKENTIGRQIVDLVRSEDPDIVCFQEFDHRRDKENNFEAYQYSYVNIEPGKVVQAIFSKFPIVNKGSLDFPDTANNAIFADIVIQKDTVRVYNLHLQSHRIVPSMRHISREPKAKLIKRMAKSFAKQQEQADLFNEDRNASPYKKIICGDLNNTQYSNVYRQIKGDMWDSFLEKGTGYGRTYNFKYYPVRIDFILVDQAFEVRAHKNYDVKLSDHFPVMASFKMDSL